MFLFILYLSQYLNFYTYNFNVIIKMNNNNKEKKIKILEYYI